MLFRSGTATITLTVTDGGSLTGTSTFDVVVNPVNDAPSFTTLGNRSHAAGAVGPQNVAGFVATTNFGPGEGAQTVLGYTVAELSDPNGIVSAAAIANDGTLTYTLSGEGGVATIRATLRDSGGTANGGVDVSAPVDFTITAIAGADLSVAISDGVTTPLPGASVAYVVDVANAGPASVAGAAVVVTPSAALTGVTWTCTATPPVTCAHASGSGPINELATLAAGQSIHYTLSGTVTGASGSTVTTSAGVTAPGSVTEIGSGANNASDVDTVGVDALFKDGFE